jgi:hypothetical protein
MTRAAFYRFAPSRERSREVVADDALQETGPMPIL